MERKDFIKYLVASAATGSAIAFIESCKKKEDTAPEAPKADFTLDLTSSANSALLTSGGFIIKDKVMVINNGGAYIALSDICTHESCALSFNSSASQLTCACHGSKFSISGSVVNGPASFPLKSYSVEKNADILHVKG